MGLDVYTFIECRSTAGAPWQGAPWMPRRRRNWRPQQMPEVWRNYRLYEVLNGISTEGLPADASADLHAWWTDRGDPSDHPFHLRLDGLLTYDWTRIQNTGLVFVPLADYARHLPWSRRGIPGARADRPPAGAVIITAAVADHLIAGAQRGIAAEDLADAGRSATALLGFAATCLDLKGGPTAIWVSVTALTTAAENTWSFLVNTMPHLLRIAHAHGGGEARNVRLIGFYA
jgi:hypothetical protein